MLTVVPSTKPLPRHSLIAIDPIEIYEEAWRVLKQLQANLQQLNNKLAVQHVANDSSFTEILADAQEIAENLTWRAAQLAKQLELLRPKML